MSNYRGPGLKGPRVVVLALVLACAFLAFGKSRAQVPTVTTSTVSKTKEVKKSGILTSTVSVTVPEWTQRLRKLAERDVEGLSKASVRGADRRELRSILNQIADSTPIAAQLDLVAAEQARREADESLLQRTASDLEAVNQALVKLNTPVAQPKEALSDEEIEAQVRAAKEDAEQAQKKVTQIRSEETARTKRLAQVPGELETLSAEQSKLTADIQLVLPKAASSPEAQTKLASLLARRLTLYEHASALKVELQRYHERREVDARRADLAANELKRAETRLSQLRALAAQREKEKAQAQAVRARAAAREAASAHPVVRRIAQENSELAELSAGEAGLTTKLPRLQRTTAQLETKRKELENAYRDIKAVVREVGLTERFGQHLRERRASLDTSFLLRIELRNLQPEISKTTVAVFELRNRRKTLSNPKENAQLRFSSYRVVHPDAPSAKDESLEVAQELLASQQQLLEQLVESQSNYLSLLREHADTMTSYIELIDEVSGFLDARLLWIRSVAPVRFGELQRVGKGLGTLAELRPWSTAYERALETLAARPLGSTWAMLLGSLLWLLIFWRGVEPLLDGTTDRPRVGSGTFAQTLHAILRCILWAGSLPVAVWGLSRLFAGAPPGSPPFRLFESAPQAIVLWFALRFIYITAKPAGLGELHFRWNPKGLEVLRSNLRWVTPLLVGLWIPFSWVASEEQDPQLAALSRAAFTASMLVVTVFVYRVLHPREDLIRPWLEKRPEGWGYRLRHLIFVMFLAYPLILAGLAAAGYFFSAVTLQNKIFATAALSLALIFFRALMLRWLRIARKDLFIQRRSEAVEAGSNTSARELVENLGEVDNQTRLVFGGVIGALFVFGLTGVWFSTIPAFDSLDRVEIYPSFLSIQSESQVAEVEPATEPPLASSKPSSEPPAVTISPTLPAPAATPVEPTRVSLRDLMMALLVFALTVAAVQNVPGVLEIVLLQRLPMDAGTRYAVSMLARYFILLIGVVWTLEVIELGWSKVQWLVAALTFGLGFGLQEIFANFVSGLIILFERPVRVGDLVSVSGTDGRVARINMRATTIVDWDLKELIVPNREFITTAVTNWTLNDRNARVVIDIGITYGGDIERALALMLEVAKKHPKTLADPEAAAYVAGVSESAWRLRSLSYIGDVIDRLRVIDELYRTLNAEFKAAGIAVAIPRVDVRVDPHQLVPTDDDGEVSGARSRNGERASELDKSP